MAKEYTLDNLYKLYDFLLPEQNNQEYGVCQITGIPISQLKDQHNHHITPKEYGGSDMWSNRIFVQADVHKLIHAKNKNKIKFYLEKLKLNKKQLECVNYYRRLAKNYEIVPSKILKLSEKSTNKAA